MHHLNTKIRLTILCLSGFELYSRWVPLSHGYVYTVNCSLMGNRLPEAPKISLWATKILNKDAV